MQELKIKQIYEFNLKTKRYFFDPDTLLVGRLDQISRKLVDILKEGGQTEANLVQRLTPPFSKNDTTEAIEELQQIGLISADYNNLNESSPGTEDSVVNVNSITLHVANDCNLRCAYCYGNGGSYSEERCLMDWQTAKDSVDFLVKYSNDIKDISVVFFGGEPLLNFRTIRKTVAYCRELEKRLDKKFTYSITTNGTLFNKENVTFMKENKFSILVSLDGTKRVHDRYRVFPSGKGSYNIIIKRLKQFFDMKTMSLRCTLPYDCFDLETSVMNLKRLRIRKAHFELADGCYDIDQMMNFYLPGIKEAFSRVASEHKKWLTDEDPFLIRNFMELLGRIHFRERKRYGCGAGRNYFSVSAKGDLYPCHRIVGNRKFMVGNIHRGFSDNIKHIFKPNSVDEIPQCQECIAKYVCAGGCLISNYAENGSMNVPSRVSCELMRHILGLALLLYVKFKNDKKLQRYFKKN
jgi:uncharacterized protein